MSVSVSKFGIGGGIYIFIAFCFFPNYTVNEFFLNLLASNVYFWFTKLLQINFNMFSGIIIVTVNILKRQTY